MENIADNQMLDQYDKAQAFQQEVSDLHHCINPKKIQRYARPSQASRISTFLNDFDSQSNGSIPNFDSSTKKEKQNNNHNKLIQLKELKNQEDQFNKKQEKLIIFNRQNSQVKNFYEKLTENSRIALEKINSIYKEKNNQSQSTEDLETRINSKIRNQIESLRLFYTQPCNSASIQHLKQNFYNTQIDSVFRLNSFDCHKYDQICFINNSNKIAQISFKEPSSQNPQNSHRYQMKDNYLTLSTDFYSSIACCNGILNNVFMYGTFTGPLVSLVDIDQQKLLKTYDNPKLSEFEICTTFCQNNYQIYGGMADGNVNLYDYRMKNKMGQIFLENMQQKVKFSPVNHISLDPNNNNQLLITKPHAIILWDLRNQTLVSELCKQAYNNSDNFLKKAYFTNNSQHAVVMKSSSNSVGVWDLTKNLQHEVIKFEANDVVKDIQYFEDLQENIFLISTIIDASTESPTLKNISPTLKQQIQFFAQNNQQENSGQQENQQTQSQAINRLEICQFSESSKKYEKLDSIHLYNYEESDSTWNNIRNLQKIKICQNGKNLYLFSNDNVYLLDYYDKDYQQMIKQQLESHLVQEEEENEEGNGAGGNSDNDNESDEND